MYDALFTSCGFVTGDSLNCVQEVIQLRRSRLRAHHDRDFQTDELTMMCQNLDGQSLEDVRCQPRSQHRSLQLPYHTWRTSSLISAWLQVLPTPPSSKPISPTSTLAFQQRRLTNSSGYLPCHESAPPFIGAFPVSQPLAANAAFGVAGHPPLQDTEVQHLLP